MLSNRKLNENVINQIKNFTFYDLTQEQQLLIDELIPSQELKERCKKFGLCKECKQINTGSNWCQFCNARHFRQEFKNWTSGNEEIDKFVQKYQLEATNSNKVLEWIPYEQFTEVEYLAKGGFCMVFKAKWTNGCIDHWSTENNIWKRKKIYPNLIVALKNLNNSQNIKADFLQEITYHKLFSSDQIVKCYGISQDLATKNYVMVVNYMKDGDLRQYLQNNYSKLSFRNKFFHLQVIAKGLNSIHEQGLVHQDLHAGNILNQVISDNVLCYIADLGLCRPADETSDGNVYGVLPYVAPEVLRGKQYTQASDIYSLGIMAYEIFSGLPSYHEFAHEEFLAVKICQGLRPRFLIKIPFLLEDLIKRCWDADPLQRPNSSELSKSLGNWYWEMRNGNDTEFYRQVKEVAKFKESFSKSLVYKTHPRVSYTSWLLDFKNLPEPQNSEEINEIFCKLSEELEDLRITNLIRFNEELEKRFNDLQIKEEKKTKEQHFTSQVQISLK